MGKSIHLLVQRCQNYQLSKKMLQIKVVEQYISNKKANEYICLSPTRVELESSKDCLVFKIL